MEGNYTFTIEFTDDDNGETFSKVFTLEIYDNPCEPDMNYDVDGDHLDGTIVLNSGYTE